MNPEKFTTKFQQALAEAQSLAAGKDHRFIEPAHLLLSMLNQRDSNVYSLLARAGANVNQIRSGLIEALERIDKVKNQQGEVHLSNDLIRLLNVTDKLAQQRHDQYLASELFLLAAVADEGAVGQ